MRLAPSLSFPVLTICTAITLTTRPGQTSSNNHSSVDITQDFQTIHCLPLPGRLSLRTCAGAILRLPIGHTVGVFHNGLPDDGFSLPVSRTYSECKVVVEMQGDRRNEDSASWLDVGRDAAEMNTWCASSAGSSLKYGSAWMNTGELDLIRIRLRPAGVWEGGNGTIADEIL